MYCSLDERVDITVHPRYLILFNDVSRYGDKYDPNRVNNEPGYDPMSGNSGLSKEKRIDDFK